MKILDGYVELYHTIKGQEPKARLRVYSPIRRCPRGEGYQRAQSKQYRQELKSTVINHYSHGTMVCAACGEDDLIVLTVDHIDNDGAKQRKQLGIKGKGQAFYSWLKKHGFPKGYQVLCRNCNYRKYIKSLEEA